VKALVIPVLALLAGAAEPRLALAASRQQFCIPPPPRTTPRGLYERPDKWQPDQRTIA
jgi:hypothetical protein